MNDIIWEGIDGLASIVSEKKILLVSTKSFDINKMKNVLSGNSYIEFKNFTPNPSYEQVCEGVKIYNEGNCNLIIAAGGGSAIDVAKCIKLFCKMESGTNYLKQKRTDIGIPLIAIPTTAGTGSESTKHAVIYYKGVKQSISSESILPDYYVLDHSLLKTLPVYYKKCSMLDALCQAIESWWSVSSTQESIQFSKKCIKLIVDNWEDYIFYDSDYSAEKILLAANCSGKAINITTTTAPHAMSYGLTSLYNLPHGHAVAICMLKVWEYMSKHLDDCIDNRGKKYLSTTFDEISDYIGINDFQVMLEKMEIECPKSNSLKDDVDFLTNSVNQLRLQNNPIELNNQLIYELYGQIVR